MSTRTNPLFDFARIPYFPGPGLAWTGFQFPLIPAALWARATSNYPLRRLCTLASLCYNFFQPFRDRLIGRTSAFGAEYPGSSPGPGTNFLHNAPPSSRI